MANKHQVLTLLEQGLSTREIAEELDCLTAYVRAVRARMFGNGKAVQDKYQKKLRARQGRF